MCRTIICAGRERRARAIVLAHGSGGTADSGLYEMADGFAQTGFMRLFSIIEISARVAVITASTFLFQCNVKIASGADCIRGLENIDPDHVGLWGFHFRAGMCCTWLVTTACACRGLCAGNGCAFVCIMICGAVKSYSGLHKKISGNLWRF